MPAPIAPQPSEDEIDDLLYLARTGDTSSLEDLLAEVAKKHHSNIVTLLETIWDADTGNGVFHMAAANGKIDTLKSLLRLSTPSSPSPPLSPVGLIINHPNSSGNIPLHYAALNGQLEATKLLLSAGAVVGTKNLAGHDAAHEAEVAGREEVAAVLIGAGEVKDGVDGDGKEEENGLGVEVEDVEGRGTD